MAEFATLAQQLREGDAARTEAAATIRLMLSDIQTTLNNLEYIRKDAKKFQKKCNVAKTVGTVSNTIGATACVGKMLVDFVVFDCNHF